MQFPREKLYLGEILHYCRETNWREISERQKNIIVNISEFLWITLSTHIHLKKKKKEGKLTCVIIPCMVQRHRVLIKGDNYNFLTGCSNHQELFIWSENNMMGWIGRKAFFHLPEINWWWDGFCVSLEITTQNKDKISPTRIFLFYNGVLYKNHSLQELYGKSPTSFHVPTIVILYSLMPSISE